MGVGKRRSDHLHQLVGGHQSVRRRARRHRLHVDQLRGDAAMGVGARRAHSVSARSASRPQHRLQDGRAARQDGRVGSARDLRRPDGRAAARREDDSVEGALLGARALYRRADRAHPRAASGRARHRPSRSAVGRRAGGRRQRLDRIHHPPGHRQRARIDLGRRHRDPSREPAREERRSRRRPCCRSISSGACARRCSACRRTTCSGSSKDCSTGRCTTESSSPTSRSTGRRSRSIGCFPFINHFASEEDNRGPQLPPLPYALDALEPHIDAQTMQIHHGKHHNAYVTNLNAALEKYPELQSKSIEDLLRDISKVPEDIRTAVRNNGGGHMNHTAFWKWMGPKAGGAPTRRARRRHQVGVRQLRRIQGAVHESRRHALRQRLGVADRARTASSASRARANQDQPIMEGKKADSRRRRVGARLLPEVSEPPAGLPRRLVERRQLDRSRFATRQIEPR